MNPTAPTTGVLAASVAEVLKIWASRVPALILAALPFGTFLFAFEIFHVEHAAEHMPSASVLDALALLYFASWKATLFQATVVAFAAYWTTLDSQYGMIRVATCQPVTRVAYLFAKWTGTAVYVALFTAAYIACLLGWALMYVGPRGLGAPEWLAIARFGFEVVLFMLSVTSVAAAAASFRATVGSGIITALLAIIALGFAMMLPFDLVPPRFVLMRFFFFPLGELPSPTAVGGDSPFLRTLPVLDFYRTAIVTPMLVVVPALVHFNRRDITE